MPDINAVKDEILGLLKDGSKGLWSGSEDLVFLEECAKDLASLRLQKLAGVAGIDKEIAIVQATIYQKAEQKSLKVNGVAEALLPKVLNILGKAAMGFLP